MTSSSSFGISQITLQFNLGRDIDAAAQDVQAAINAAGSTLPRNLPYPPTYSKVNPADAPIVTLALTSRHAARLRQLSDLADTLLAQRLSAGHRRRPRLGRGRHAAGRAHPGRPRRGSPPTASSMEDLRTAIAAANVAGPKGSLDGAQQSYTIAANDQIDAADGLSRRRHRLSQRRAGAAARTSPTVEDGLENTRVGGWYNGKPGGHRRRSAPARRQRHRDRRRASRPSCRGCEGACRPASTLHDRARPHRHHPRLDPRRAVHAGAERRRSSSWSCCSSCAPSRATIIAGVALPLSLIATFGVMWLLRLQRSTTSR